MDNKHNDDNYDDNDTTIKRKQGRGTRMQDEDKARGRGTRTMRDNNDDNEDEGLRQGTTNNTDDDDKTTIKKKTRTGDEDAGQGRGLYNIVDIKVLKCLKY